MDTRSVLSAVVAGVALAGCAAMPGSRMLDGDSPANPCNAGTCDVGIAVTGCASANITAAPDSIYVGRTNSPVMHWKIDIGSWLQGWGFADSNGIAFKNAPAGEFTLDSQSNLSVKFKNKHTPSDKPDGIKYEYGINIVKRGSTPGSIAETCPQKDPFVVNL